MIDLLCGVNLKTMNVCGVSETLFIAIPNISEEIIWTFSICFI